MELFKLIEILGTAAFAISGVIAAMEKKLDLFGIFIIASVTAMGGGTLRDVLMDVPVSWMLHPEYMFIVLISAIVAVLFANTIKQFQKALLLFDAMGLGLFTILGLQKGLLLGLHPVICITLGTITACFGGVVRDMLLNTIPMLFHKKEIYATACILGGALYFVLREIYFPAAVIDITCIVIIVLVRLVAVKKNWSLPDIYKKNRS